MRANQVVIAARTSHFAESIGNVPHCVPKNRVEGHVSLTLCEQHLSQRDLLKAAAEPSGTRR